jgi:hypothetical protein
LLFITMLTIGADALEASFIAKYLVSSRSTPMSSSKL